ncbi:hypothetical protein [Reyranella sp.]|uniref:hypothetical protein n=1 Tax=Reyranella sp. TaxID=1929291 RepID=UPI003D09CCB1
MSAPDKDSDFKPFLTLSDQVFGKNLNAFVAQIALVAGALFVIYAACRLFGWLR